MIALPIWLTGKGLGTFSIFSSPLLQAFVVSVLRPVMQSEQKIWFVTYECDLYSWYTVMMSPLVFQLRTETHVSSKFPSDLWSPSVHITQRPLIAMSWMKSGETELDVLQNCIWCAPPTHGAFSPYKWARISQKQRPSEIYAEQSLA